MVSSSRWERDKNAALLELENRNRSLQAKLLESESEKDENARSSEVQKMQGQILQAIHETFDKAGSYAPPPPTKDVVPPVDTVGRTSVWEWQKNTALLELEHRNQQLQRLLKTKDREAVISEQEKELLNEGYERGKECMRLYGQLRAMQGSAVLQAQRIFSTKRLHAVMHQWRRYSRQRKFLRKAEHLWNRRLLKTSVRALALSSMMNRTAKKLNWIAYKHHNKKLMLRSFQSWLLVIKWKEASRERVVLFNVLQKFRLVRAAYGAWKYFLTVVNKTSILERKAERFCLTHRWTRWTAAASITRVRVAQAEVFCRLRRVATAFQTWSMNSHEAVLERARAASSEEHRKMSLKQRAFRLLRGSAQHQALLGRRLDKIITFKTRRTLLFTFLGWRQRAQSKKEVTIWRRMLVVKQQIRLMQQAFQGWDRTVKQRKKASRLHSQQNSRRRKAVFHYWLRLCDDRKLLQQRMCHMRQRRHHSQLKDIFRSWLMHVEESRRSLLLRDAELLQAQLELSRQELHSAGDVQAELTRLVKSLEMEKGVLERKMQAVTSRMPVWTSGFLDAELRWRLPEPAKGTAPSARAGHVAVAVSLGAGPSSFIVLAGGYDGYSILNDVCVFDEVQNVWRNPSIFLGPGSAFPPPVRHHTACWHQGKLVLFGGFDGTRDSADLSILTLAHDGSSGELSQPEARVGIKPGPMSQHSSCLCADRNLMLVFGGYRSGVGHLNELWTLDLQWMEWHSPEYFGEAPAARRGHGAAIVGRKMYMFGGFDGKCNLADFYALDLDTMYWQAINTQGQAPSPRRHHSMAALGRHLVVYGGYNGEDYLNDVYSYDTEACFWKRWTVMKPPQPVFATNYRRSMHAMVISGHRLVVIGGVHAHGPLLDMIYLENGAAVDGLELERQLTAERNRGRKLEEQVAVCEATLQQKVADLALAYSKISQCQAALKVEARERKLAVSRQRVLIQKLKKTRKKSSLW